MKKFIIITSLIVLLAACGYQATIKSRSALSEFEDDPSDYQPLSPYERAFVPVPLKTIRQSDNYYFRDAKINDHDEARLRKRFTHDEVPLDEPETLIPRTSVSPKAPAPYPLEKRYTQ